MNSKLLARTFLIIFCLLILAGSSIPYNKIPKGFLLTPDKLIHCIEYFILGLLIYRWLIVEFNPHKTFLLILLTIFIGSAFGALDETYQQFTPGRTPDFWDWVLDTVGAMLSVPVGIFLWSKKRNSQ